MGLLSADLTFDEQVPEAIRVRYLYITNNCWYLNIECPFILMLKIIICFRIVQTRSHQCIQVRSSLTQAFYISDACTPRAGRCPLCGHYYNGKRWWGDPVRHSYGMWKESDHEYLGDFVPIWLAVLCLVIGCVSMFLFVAYFNDMRIYSWMLTFCCIVVIWLIAHHLPNWIDWVYCKWRQAGSHYWFRWKPIKRNSDWCYSWTWLTIYWHWNVLWGSCAMSTPS